MCPTLGYAEIYEYIGIVTRLLGGKLGRREVGVNAKSAFCLMEKCAIGSIMVLIGAVLWMVKMGYCRMWLGIGVESMEGANMNGVTVRETNVEDFYDFKFDGIR